MVVNTCGRNETIELVVILKQTLKYMCANGVVVNANFIDFLNKYCCTYQKLVFLF